MRRPFITGIAATVGALSLSLALASGMVPAAYRQSNNDVQITWSPSTAEKSGAVSYEVRQCPYRSSPDAKCRVVAEVFTGFTDYSAVISATDVMTSTQPYAKVIPLDAQGIEIAGTRENVAIPAAIQPPVTPIPADKHIIRLPAMFR